MLDPKLLKIINKGRCFALIGSGPSCEMGYPSWQGMAEIVLQHLTSSGLISDIKSYEAFVTQNRFPEFFWQAETDFGGRKKLINFLQNILIPTHYEGRIYKMLSRWPFCCYLTTNYDDEIDSHLKRQGIYYETLINNIEDFRRIRNDATHLIIKLHGDFSHPDNLVITSRDYHKFGFDPEYAYFRDKLKTIMNMFDVLILGHSLTDSDLRMILETAKNTASPEHPIYMITSNTTRGEINEYWEKYNIVIHNYDDLDGTHSQLHRILSVADRFISPSSERIESNYEADDQEVDAAMGLFLFRRLKKLQKEGLSGQAEFIAPLILNAINMSPQDKVKFSDIIGNKLLSSLNSNGGDLQGAIRAYLKEMVNNGEINLSNGYFSLTKGSRKHLADVSQQRRLEEDQAYGQFIVTLRRQDASLTKEEEEQTKTLLKNTLVQVFKTRGLAIASKIFADRAIFTEDLSDIFREISHTASALDNSDLRASFIESAHEFIIEPTIPQKNYLMSLSQGYFMYHLAGLDPACSKIRHKIFRNTAWICDSSVLLPLIAKGCHHHDYATDLFDRLKRKGGQIYTTPRLIREAWIHLGWAINFVKKNPIDTPNFISCALVQRGYKQNLFIDGYIRCSAEGLIGTFTDYLDLICPSRLSLVNFIETFNLLGINMLDIEKIDGFSEEDETDILSIGEAVRTERQYRGTHRSELQVQAEAEVLFIINKLREGIYSIDDPKSTLDRIYFLSPSKILDSLEHSEQIITWLPEALYRYLMVLPGEVTDPDFLQKCVLNEYYYAGISFVDTKRYVKFFGHSINTAKISFQNEKDGYLRETEISSTQELETSFNETPDLEKPAYVMHMAWIKANAAGKREKAALARAEIAEATVQQLETEKEAAWKTRKKAKDEQQKAELKHLNDPKHQRKRKRQAKKRTKKKRQ